MVISAVPASAGCGQGQRHLFGRRVELHGGVEVPAAGRDPGRIDLEVEGVEGQRVGGLEHLRLDRDPAFEGARPRGRARARGRSGSAGRCPAIGTAPGRRRRWESRRVVFTTSEATDAAGHGVAGSGTVIRHDRYECFDVDISDGVAHLQLNRPDALNTMVPSFWRELPEHRAGHRRRRQGPGDRDLVDRQALLRRHGPVGVHRRFRPRWIGRGRGGRASTQRTCG